MFSSKKALRKSLSPRCINNERIKKQSSSKDHRSKAQLKEGRGKNVGLINQESKVCKERLEGKHSQSMS